ncbi:MAG TPA: cytochrome P450 [Polyangia bacterium]|nr:cytochrome P450 [Polyangia bacterium]
MAKSPQPAAARPQGEFQGDAGAFVRVAASKDLEGDGPHAVSARGVDLILVRTPGGPRVYQGRCPHQGALLGEGELEAGQLVCRNHRWRFDVDTGARQGGPQCLIACPAVERDGEVRVDPAGLTAVQAAQAPHLSSARTRKLADLPGPRGWPVLGNALELDLERLHLIFERWARTYGAAFRFRMGSDHSVVVSSPELAQQVLRARPDTFRRVSQVERVFQELCLAGVFSAEGAAWRSQRRLAMEALAQRHLRGFYPTLRAVAERLRRRWEAAAESGATVDMVEDLKRFTVDVTTALTFGHDMNTIDAAGDDVVQRQLELLFPAFNRRIFALIPLWRLVRLPRDRALDRALRDLRTWLDQLVASARARLSQQPDRAANPTNFLEAMITARDESGQPFSDDVIFANLMTMLLAGEDTTAYTLGWAVHHLCDSPEAIKALQAELDASGDGVPADLEAANALAYAGAVANESMRLRPVAPIIAVEALSDTFLESPDGHIEIPTGTGVIVLVRPPVVEAARFHDPQRFLPERWLDAGAGGAHDPSAHIPFGSGPRICPGRSLALLEMRVLLSMLYRNFQVTRDGRPEDVEERFSFTMSPVGLRVRLARREAPAVVGRGTRGAVEQGAPPVISS